MEHSNDTNFFISDTRRLVDVGLDRWFNQEDLEELLRQPISYLYVDRRYDEDKVIRAYLFSIACQVKEIDPTKHTFRTMKFMTATSNEVGGYIELSKNITCRPFLHLGLPWTMHYIDFFNGKSLDAWVAACRHKLMKNVLIVSRVDSDIFKYIRRPNIRLVHPSMWKIAVDE